MQSVVSNAFLCYTSNVFMWYMSRNKSIPQKHFKHPKSNWNMERHIQYQSLSIYAQKSTHHFD